MKAIDMHSHFWGKKGGLYSRVDLEERASAEKAYGFKPGNLSLDKTDEEMAQDLRKAGVKAIFDFGFTMGMPIEEVKELHDYAAQVRRDYRDVFIGTWITIDPRTGLKGLREVERCFKDLGGGFWGVATNAAGLGIPPSDRAWYPFLDMCMQAKRPFLTCVGYTGWGSGVRGGRGFVLENCHPRYVDEIAARFPDMTIIAARPAWPWTSEIIAVLRHKANVWTELHGWSPKYFADELKLQISHQLQDKVMFGADYPMFTYERLFRDWESLGYSPEVLEKVYYRNAQRLFGELGYKLD